MACFLWVFFWCRVARALDVDRCVIYRGCVARDRSVALSIVVTLCVVCVGSFAAFASRAVFVALLACDVIRYVHLRSRFGRCEYLCASLFLVVNTFANTCALSFVVAIHFVLLYVSCNCICNTSIQIDYVNPLLSV